MQEVGVESSPELGDASTRSRRLLRRLAIAAAGLGLAVLGLQLLARAIDVPFIDNTIRAEWAVAVHVGRSPAEISGTSATAFITKDDVPLDEVIGVADPFLVSLDDRLVLLAEVIVRDPEGRFGERGLIGTFESLDGGASWQWRGTALEAPTHFSYPMPLLVDGDWYLVPESGDTGETVLYRAEDFPTRWVRDTVLLEGDWGDSTIVEIDGTWFLFAVDTTGESYGENLHLFNSPTLQGPWEEHPESPVVRGDASRARPAGPLFEDDAGRLWRPAQQNANAYGEQVRAFEVLELTAEHYSESESGDTLAEASGEGWNASGMHHVSVVEDGGTTVTVVDGFRLIQERSFGL